MQPGPTQQPTFARNAVNSEGSSGALRRFVAAVPWWSWAVLGLGTSVFCGCIQRPSAAQIQPDMQRALQFRSDLEHREWE